MTGIRTCRRSKNVHGPSCSGDADEVAWGCLRCLFILGRLILPVDGLLNVAFFTVVCASQRCWHCSQQRDGCEVISQWLADRNGNNFTATTEVPQCYPRRETDYFYKQKLKIIITWERRQEQIMCLEKKREEI